ncbi:retrotransposon gag domain-containing protein, partial [Klebsiella pneumoniae]|uniref:retrotransposon gag family protein n=1 Tax=Klebsiella pneumoniae TaxID=573 RepID=UPI00193A28CA
AEAWLLAIEQIFTLLQIADDDLRMMIAPCYFRDTATIWWANQKELLGQTDLTWAAFRALFLDTYFPEALQDRKYFEFLNLVQGNMSVHEYQLKFNTLARYAPEYVATEKRRY